MRKKITVIGAGAWGTAIANLIADAGRDALLWSCEEPVVNSIQKQHENTKYLKGCRLSKKVHATGDLVKSLESSDWIFCAIPTQVIREVFAPHAGLLEGKRIVNAAKGIELKTHKCVSEIFEDITPKAKYFVLSGPSFAAEVARGLPTAVTIASKDSKGAAELQKLLSTGYFRAYTSDDVIGVELSGALKNVMALASGMVVGLQLGYNAQAAIINRGMVEIARMGRKKGANPITFLGLSGMGDLVLTCTGPLSRNRKLGGLLAEGVKIQKAQKLLEGVAEGYFTAKSAYRLSKKLRIEMPITEQVYHILYEKHTPQRALSELMSRDLKHEWT